MQAKKERLNLLLKERKELWRKSDELGEELSKIHMEIDRIRADLILDSGILALVPWKLSTISSGIIVLKPLPDSQSRLFEILSSVWTPDNYHCETPILLDIGDQYDTTIIALRYDDGDFSISSHLNVDAVLKLIKDQGLSVDLSKLEQIKENCEKTLKMTNELIGKF